MQIKISYENKKSTTVCKLHKSSVDNCPHIISISSPTRIFHGKQIASEWEKFIRKISTHRKWRQLLAMLDVHARNNVSSCKLCLLRWQFFTLLISADYSQCPNVNRSFQNLLNIFYKYFLWSVVAVVAVVFKEMKSLGLRKKERRRNVKFHFFAVVSGSKYIREVYVYIHAFGYGWLFY